MLHQTVDVGNGRRGIYMSDGVMNVALLGKESDKERIGLYHFGMWVDDLAEAEKRMETFLAGSPGGPEAASAQKMLSEIEQQIARRQARGTTNP